MVSQYLVWPSLSAITVAILLGPPGGACSYLHCRAAIACFYLNLFIASALRWSVLDRSVFCSLWTLVTFECADASVHCCNVSIVVSDEINNLNIKPPKEWIKILDRVKIFFLGGTVRTEWWRSNERGLVWAGNLDLTPRKIVIHHVKNLSKG